MLTRFLCPLCDADAWEHVRTHVYRAAEHVHDGQWQGNEYVALRRRVLFEVWFPGTARIELTTQFCRECGFMCYTPRPEAADLDAKYEFLRETEVDIGGQVGVSESGIRMDQVRALRTYRLLSEGKDLSGKALLDVGGGDGKLMGPFLEHGTACFLVDYNPNPREGVVRLGDTARDVPGGMRFDLVTCCHVLEHVAEPVPFLGEILGVLKPGGRAFFEVPLEIWGDIPIAAEPVTHQNFFTPASLRFGLARAGFNVLRAEPAVASYGNYRIQVAWAVAEKAPGVARPRPPGSGPTRRLIAPGPLDKAKRALLIEPRLERSARPLLRFAKGLLRRFPLGTKNGPS